MTPHECIALQQGSQPVDAHDGSNGGGRQSWRTPVVYSQMRVGEVVAIKGVQGQQPQGWPSTCKTHPMQS